jgi:hypothetical protein
MKDVIKRTQWACRNTSQMVVLRSTGLGLITTTRSDDTLSILISSIACHNNCLVNLNT